MNSFFFIFNYILAHNISGLFALVFAHSFTLRVRIVQLLYTVNSGILTSKGHGFLCLLCSFINAQIRLENVYVLEQIFGEGLREYPENEEV